MKWFKHDTNANQDAKLRKILIKYGADGYAIYWYCLELIAGKIDKNNVSFELEHDAILIGYDLKIDTIRVEEIMKYMVYINLFEINEETNRIMCLKLASRLDDTTSKNPEIRSVLANAKETGKIEHSRQYVYVFQDGDKYKIGKTVNLTRRFADAKTLNTNISLIHFIETVDNGLMENAIQTYLSDKRIEGEWFALGKEDIDFLFTIKSIDDIPKTGAKRKRSEPFGADKIRLDKNRLEEITYKDTPQKKPAELVNSTPKHGNPTKDAFYKAWNDCFLSENGFAYTWVAADWVQYAKYNVDAISPEEIVAMVKAWFTLPPETGSFNTRKVCVLVSNLAKAKALLKAAPVQVQARAEDW